MGDFRCIRSSHTAHIPHPEYTNSIVYGQPTFYTHPHLLKKDELLPGIKTEEFVERRQKFIDLIAAETKELYGVDKHHVVILPSASKVYMSEKIPYVFRQNTDFLYFSGCLEPDTALVLTGHNADDYISTIFVRGEDKHSELWDGPSTGVDGAIGLFKVHEALPMKRFSSFLSSIAESYQNQVICYDMQNSSQSSLHNIVKKHIDERNLPVFDRTKNVAHKLRVTKSQSEQELMKKSCKIASEAIKKTISSTSPGMTEHQLFATVDYESRMRGAEILAYPPVVASGNNANIIHYINNTQEIQNGDLILMDAGCEYHGYCSDITRTWPANEKYDKYQRILYELLLDIQCELVKLCDQKISLDKMYQMMVHYIAKKLADEKIAKKNVEDIHRLAYDLCPHHVGHYLGMDVHDSATVPRNIELKPGTIITVEPGIYIRKDNSFITEEFRGCGIRIEDDVLITDTGYIVLSEDCPKTVPDIEALCRR